MQGRDAFSHRWPHTVRRCVIYSCRTRMTQILQVPTEAPRGLTAESSAEIESELDWRYHGILQGPRPLDLPSLSTPQAAAEAAGLALLSESTAILRAKHVEFLHSAHHALTHVSAMSSPCCRSSCCYILRSAHQAPINLSVFLTCWCCHVSCIRASRSALRPLFTTFDTFVCRLLPANDGMERKLYNVVCHCGVD